MSILRFCGLAIALCTARAPRCLQAQVDEAVRISAIRQLAEEGELELRGAMHGPAPMIVLLTEAPAAASAPDRQYQHELTVELISQIRARGFSYFSFVPRADSAAGAGIDDSLGPFEESAARILTLLRQAAPPGGAPHAIIGFGEGAIVAGRLVARDPLLRYLVALVPSVRAGGADSGRREARWDDVVLARERLPSMLLVHSPCNGAVPQGLLDGFGLRYPVMVLANFDGWLAPAFRGRCTPAFERSGRAASLTFAPFVMEWLRPLLPFFE